MMQPYYHQQTPIRPSHRITTSHSFLRFTGKTQVAKQAASAWQPPIQQTIAQCHPKANPDLPNRMKAEAATVITIFHTGSGRDE